MKIYNPETKDTLIQRLRRIEGQVRGVQGMLNEERDCREIMQQLGAIHSAVQSTSRVFLQDYATACLAEMENVPDSGDGKNSKATREKMVQDMIALLDKTP
jgi:DNA-binding FrmR family transcriptional regulator